MFNHFDILAPVYDRLLGTRDLKRLREILDLPTEGWMLDAGGGTGRLSSRLRRFVGNVVIVDPSSAMLKQAQRKGHLSLVKADAERLPFPDERFERIVVVDALHHFHDQRRAIRDLLRVLKPGGRLVVEEPDINRLPVKLAALGEKLTRMKSHFFSPLEIRDMIVANGIPAKIEGDSRFTAWVVANK
jgi:ubiquinone/menaquinone biosynthesis C-methylase UbiE